jgi:hypothetical protein
MIVNFEDDKATMYKNETNVCIKSTIKSKNMQGFEINLSVHHLRSLYCPIRQSILEEGIEEAPEEIC